MPARMSFADMYSASDKKAKNETITRISTTEKFVSVDVVSCRALCDERTAWFVVLEKVACMGCHLAGSHNLRVRGQKDEILVHTSCLSHIAHDDERLQRAQIGKTGE